MSLAIMCCDVILTENGFKINYGIYIHGPSMSNLYASRDNDHVLRRTTRYNYKIYSFRMQVCAKRGRGRVKNSLDLYRADSKLCPVECQVYCFSYNQRYNWLKSSLL